MTGPTAGSTSGSGDCHCARACASDRAPSGLLPSDLLQQIHQGDLVADLEAGEIHDDVVALRRALLIQPRQGDRMDREVPVVGNELERDEVAVLVCQTQLNEPRHGAIDEAESILSRQDLHVRLPGVVDSQQIAHEPVGGEDVEIDIGRPDPSPDRR